MTSEPRQFASFQLSTDDLPERDRLECWREVIGRTILRMEVSPLPDKPLQVRLAGHAMPGLVVLRGVNGGLRMERTSQLLADGNDDLHLPLTVTGTSIVSVRGQEAAVGDGDTILMSSSDRGFVTYPSTVRYTSVSVPRKALMPLVPRLEDGLMRLRPIRRDNAALRLLRGYANLLSDNPPATPDLRRHVAAHIHDLVALVIGASRDAAAIAEGRGLRVARLHAIKADIAAHLGDRGLTVSGVAARQAISARYVQMLFEEEGTTFSQYVLNRRLVRAHRMLTDPRHARLAIGTVALEAGFGDLSTFNHAFRRLYRASPSDVRAAGRRQDRG